MTMSQGALGANTSWGRLGTESLLEILEGTVGSLISGIWSLELRAKCTPSVLRYPGCSDLSSSHGNLAHTMADSDSLLSFYKPLP